MKQLLLIFLLVIITTSAFCQRTKTDSLYNIIRTSTLDTVKVKAKIELGEELNILRSSYWDSLAMPFFFF